MDFYVVRPDPEHEGEVTRDVFHGADARYWFEQGGVLVASGCRRCRVSRPATRSNPTGCRIRSTTRRRPPAVRTAAIPPTARGSAPPPTGAPQVPPPAGHRHIPTRSRGAERRDCRIEMY